MRHKLASGLLIISVITWGIWCGGQVFNELMTVPIWSASPPASLKGYSELPREGGAPFFPLFNPLFVVLAIGAAFAAWKEARKAMQLTSSRRDVYAFCGCHRACMRAWRAQRAHRS